MIVNIALTFLLIYIVAKLAQKYEAYWNEQWEQERLIRESERMLSAWKSNEDSYDERLRQFDEIAKYPNIIADDEEPALDEDAVIRHVTAQLSQSPAAEVVMFPSADARAEARLRAEQRIRDLGGRTFANRRVSK